MLTTTIRIDKAVHNKLKDISHRMNKSMNSVIDEMVTEYRKKIFWDNVNNAFEVLQSNKMLWQEELNERKIWENSFLDSDEK
jgi:hypothetical protein